MLLRVKSTGYRQKAWEALAREQWPSVQTLADELGCAHSGLAAYVRALNTEGYLAFNNLGEFRLGKHTGPRAPSISEKTGSFKDWNLDPVMTGAELGAAIDASGLGLAGWMAKHGLHAGGATRLRHMISGQRPVSEEIAGKVRASG